MYLIILFLPLISSLNLLFFGSLLGKSKSGLVACTLLFCGMLGSLAILFETVVSNLPTFITLDVWFTLPNSKIEWIFSFDRLSSIMCSVVLVVSFFVHLFSHYYLRNDPHQIRFFSYLSIFTFFMLFLVTSGTFLQLILGWEGVGLTSFLLINFWFTRIEANKASLKAVLINRVGDCGLIFSILLIYSFFAVESLFFLDAFF